jgi:hypothetical protein
LQELKNTNTSPQNIRFIEEQLIRERDVICQQGVVEFEDDDVFKFDETKIGDKYMPDLELNVGFDKDVVTDEEEEITVSYMSTSVPISISFPQKPELSICEEAINNITFIETFHHETTLSSIT